MSDTSGSTQPEQPEARPNPSTLAPAPGAEPAAAAGDGGGAAPPPPPMHGGSTPPPGGGSSGSSDQSDEIDKLIFKRDVDEVHLLIDFISGRADKNLNDLKLPNPSFDPAAQAPDPNANATLTPIEGVKHLSLIRYPPSRVDKIRAEDAALLLLAKDQLAALAAPARSATIAYTDMFVSKVGWLPFYNAEARDYRLGLAQSTFPNLRPHVSKFSFFYLALIIFSFVWLFLTALTYWDVAMGRSILQGIDQLTKEHATIVQANPTATACAAGGSATDPNCVRIKALTDKEIGATAKLTGFVVCAPDCNHYIHVLRWGFVLCGFDPSAAKADDKYLVDGMAFVLTVFSTYILPMMFGLLGTAIAAIRAIQNKVRDFELGPRDLVLTLMGLPIGLVAGVAVGLFYAPSSAPTTGSGNLAGDLSLSAAGLGFLAGYGSEAFFKSLDALLTRVFTARGSPPATTPTAPRQG